MEKKFQRKVIETSFEKGVKRVRLSEKEKS